MTPHQVFNLVGDIVQFVIGAWFIGRGYSQMYRRWDRTDLGWHTGLILVGVGVVILFLLRVR